ncbi:cryptochrome/photolyase family protein [Roseovarius amoyensis]|uniref:cryptochrome/photolyase family protein n=1 Tax=Roseovarius amoyensis TaxID=2211448 RepID=UPI000DBE3B62|nr:deoxyribodipyrimidine photo-lyase [Roseovarius amoyensis]
MTAPPPTLVWFRRDLRLGDHPALCAAIARGGPVILVFIRDAQVDTLGAGPKWRLGLSLADLSRQLQARGSRLILRSGPVEDVLAALVRETGADAVHWTRGYDPGAIAAGTAVKTMLRADGIAADSHPGHLLHEPRTVKTGAGGCYRVYSPFWRAIRGRDVPAPMAEPGGIPPPDNWPDSDSLSDWRLGAAMGPGAAVCLPHQRVGEAAARARLDWFMDEAIAGYGEARDRMAEDGCSGLSQNLGLGEVSPRQCWHAALRALNEGAQGAESWLRQLAWREFAWHLLYHFPGLDLRNWREGWEEFPWSTDPDSAAVRRWKRGRTGVPLVDAAMRQMYVTGQMHNRARMIAASYLTKHMLVHWKVGLDWFAQCLTDWDPAANAMGWQWVAGCGPDASPYFRIFNPETQATKFDSSGAYRRRWIAEGQTAPPQTALGFFDAAPAAWGLRPDAPYPAAPMVGLAEGRARALAAYDARPR